MKHFHLFIVVAGLVAVPGIAQSSGKSSTATEVATADAASVTVTPNAMIVSADGRRIGHVDHIRSVNGSPTFASVVVRGQFVNVPLSSLTAKDGNFVSSLNANDLMKR